MTQTTPPRNARLSDIARECGLSRATVSKVLLGTGGPNTRVSPDTAKRIKAAARKLQFQPNQAARQLKGVRTRLIGLITGFGASQVLLDKLMRFETEAWHRGYRLLPGHAHADPDRAMSYLADLITRGAEGLVFVDFHGTLLKAISHRLTNCPPSVFQCRLPIQGQPCVVLDRSDGVCQAVHHLAQRGRQRIGLMVASTEDPGLGSRSEGYLRGLSERNLAIDPILHWKHVDTITSASEFDHAVEQLVVKGKADSVITSNDMVAVRMIKALRSRGLRVPQDVAVVGFDNLDIAAISDPELTSIDQCNVQVVNQTLRMLTSMIETGQAAERQVIVKPKLIVREST